MPLLAEKTVTINLTCCISNRVGLEVKKDVGMEKHSGRRHRPIPAAGNARRPLRPLIANAVPILKARDMRWRAHLFNTPKLLPRFNL
jgi:hypothetical protein